MVKIECPRLGPCEMFHLFDSAGFTEVWKAAYCRGNFPRCERYQLFLKGEKVPPALLPNGERFPTPHGRKG